TATLDRRFGIGIHGCVGSIAHRSARPAGGSEEIVTTAAGRAPKAKKAKRRAPRDGGAGPLVVAWRNRGKRGGLKKTDAPPNGVRTMRSAAGEKLVPLDGVRRDVPARREERGSRGGFARRDAPVRTHPVDRLWSSYRRGPTDDSRNRLVEAYQGL